MSIVHQTPPGYKEFVAALWLVALVALSAVAVGCASAVPAETPPRADLPTSEPATKAPTTAVTANAEATTTAEVPPAAMKGFDFYEGGPGPAEAARRADLIAMANVTGRLATFTREVDCEANHITSERACALLQASSRFTPYQFQIGETLKGAPPDDGKIILNSLAEQAPLPFEQGEKVLLFLKDCGTERATAMGSEGFRFRLVSRYIVADGNAFLFDSVKPMDEMRATVEANRDLPPKSEMAC